MSGNVTLAFFQASRPFSKRTLPRRAPTPFGLPTTAPPVASPSTTASTTASPPAREPPATAAVAPPTARQAVSLPSSSTGLRHVFNGEVGQLRQHLAPACRHHLAGPSTIRDGHLSNITAARRRHSSCYPIGNLLATRSLKRQDARK